MRTTALAAGERQPYRESFEDGQLGELLRAVASAGINGIAQADPRLQYVAAAGLEGGIPSAGGFLVPPDLAMPLHERTWSTGEVLSRCAPWPAARDLRIPLIDETSRADGSRFGGVSLAFVEAGAELPAGKPKFALSQLKRKKLGGLMHLSNELLADADQLAAVVERLYALEAAFVIEQQIVAGGGIVGPLGILNSGALITTPKEAGQAADTIVAANVVKMFARLWNGGKRRAVWLVNTDIFPQLLSLTWGSGTAAVPLARWGDDGDLMLCGRPVVEHEASSSLGNLGDIILADLGEYFVTNPDDQLVIAFDPDRAYISDEGAFRFVLRVDGHPAWSSPTTPLNGTVTVSPFVTLAARA
jgi:HK97 family phage major capsid protein